MVAAGQVAAVSVEVMAAAVVDITTEVWAP
jgi:hypothetical protein